MKRTTYTNIVASNNQNEVLIEKNNEIDENLYKDSEEGDDFIKNSHPLYLQNIDHLELVLLSKKFTGTENFGPWKMSLSIALSAMNKMTIVDGTFLRPDEASPLRY